MLLMMMGEEGLLESPARVVALVASNFNAGPLTNSLAHVDLIHLTGIA
jgi:hypothetical protein